MQGRPAFLNDGATYYRFTVRTHRSRCILCNADVRGALRHALGEVRKRWPFRIYAWVLLPDHLHGVWALPCDSNATWDDHGHQRRWTAIKGRVTRAVGRRYFLRTWLEDGSHRNRDASRKVWAGNDWVQRIDSARELRASADYLHWNPVGHGLVPSADRWPYSTFHDWLRSGRYDTHWSGGPTATTPSFGE